MSAWKLIVSVLGVWLLVRPGATLEGHSLVQAKDKDIPLAGSFYGRSGAIRDKALREGGGSAESEAAVARGLSWLARMQQPDGKWMLDDPRFKDKGTPNHTAGTAFGLLPFLGAGKTHKPARNNQYAREVQKGLMFLIKQQDKKTGNFGGGMYAHGLATIALCEAYGLSKDPLLRKPAQMGVDYLIQAQHERGGWRYSPGQAGDTSVTGWQVMALKSAEMAGLDVSQVTLRGVQQFLDGCSAADEGYGYTGPGSTPSLSAIGLLCRMYLQSWGPSNVRLIKGVDNHIRKAPPSVENMYYSYYATQLMHHYGGEAWKEWNTKMREDLIKAQDRANGPMDGSFPAKAAAHNAGRLMQTSLCLLTLEVYYRYLPLSYEGKVGDEKP